VVPLVAFMVARSIPQRGETRRPCPDPGLQVIGQTTVFALSDLSTADAKMAGFAGHQAAIVAANVGALAAGSAEFFGLAVEARE
jgi:hypothetical protein